jgi:hypothetical protein
VPLSVACAAGGHTSCSPHPHTINNTNRPDSLGVNCLDPDQVGGWADGSGGSDSSGGGLLPASMAASLGLAMAPTPPGPARRKVKGRLAGGTSVLVGALEGSLYALPADHLMLMSDDSASGGSSSSKTAATAVWPQRRGRMALDITPAEADMCRAGPGGSKAQQQATGVGAAAASGEDNSRAAASDNSSGALALLDDSGSGGARVVTLAPVDSGAVIDELGSLTCPQPPLGIHPITRQAGGQHVTWLPLGGSDGEQVGWWTGRLVGWEVIGMHPRQPTCRLMQHLTPPCVPLTDCG